MWKQGWNNYCVITGLQDQTKPQKDEVEVVPPPPWGFVLAKLELRQIPNHDFIIERKAIMPCKASWCITHNTLDAG